MEKVTEQVELAKEFNDVRKALVIVVTSAKAALADGFQPGQDVPAVGIASYAALLEAMKGLGEIAPGFKEDLGASVRVGGLLGADLVDALVK